MSGRECFEMWLLVIVMTQVQYSIVFDNGETELRHPSYPAEHISLELLVGGKIDRRVVFPFEALKPHIVSEYRKRAAFGQSNRDWRSILNVKWGIFAKPITDFS